MESSDNVVTTEMKCMEGMRILCSAQAVSFIIWGYVHDKRVSEFRLQVFNLLHELSA